jgi:hypothetical protein
MFVNPNSVCKSLKKVLFLFKKKILSCRISKGLASALPCQIRLSWEGLYPAHYGRFGKTATLAHTSTWRNSQFNCLFVFSAWTTPGVLSAVSWTLLCSRRWMSFAVARIGLIILLGIYFSAMKILASVSMWILLFFFFFFHIRNGPLSVLCNSLLFLLSDFSFLLSMSPFCLFSLSPSVPARSPSLYVAFVLIYAC